MSRQIGIMDQEELFSMKGPPGIVWPMRISHINKPIDSTNQNFTALQSSSKLHQITHNKNMLV